MQEVYFRECGLYQWTILILLAINVALMPIKKTFQFAIISIQLTEIPK